MPRLMPRHATVLTSLFLFSLVLSMLPVATALPPAPYVNCLYPGGMQRGTTLKVKVFGDNLKDATRVDVSGGDVTCKITPFVPKKPALDKNGKPIKPKNSKVKKVEPQFILTLTAAPNAELGIRDVRVITPAGISNAFRFAIGGLPEISEVEPNGSKEMAQDIGELPKVINGQVIPYDLDYFRFNAKKGDTLVFAVQARILKPYIADAVPGWFQNALLIYDAKGEEVAFNDDFRYDPDAVLFFTPPADGQYTLHIRDMLYRGRDDLVYRIAAGKLPFLTDVFPLAAKFGEKQKLTLRGINLPAEERTVDLSDAALKKLGYDPAELGERVYLPIPSVEGKSVAYRNERSLLLTRNASTTEVEPNNKFKQPQKIELPASIRGVINKPGDIDAFQFDFATGVPFEAEVFARRVGSSLDSHLLVTDSKSIWRKLGEKDDWKDNAHGLLTHQADSRVEAVPKYSGQATLVLSDRQGQGGDSYEYLLVVRRSEPDFELFVHSDDFRLSPGGTCEVGATAVRRGYDGPIEIKMEGLSEGFRLEGGTISERQDRTRMTITAPKDAKPGVFYPTFQGVAKINNETVPTSSVAPKNKGATPKKVVKKVDVPEVKPYSITRHAAPATEQMQAFIYHHLVPAKELPLAVVEGGMFTLEPIYPEGLRGEDGVVEVKRGTSFTMKVKATRKKVAANVNKAKESKAAASANKPMPIKITAQTPPKGINVRATQILADKNESEIRVSVSFVALGQYNIILFGSMKVGKDAEDGTICPAIPIRIVK